MASDSSKSERRRQQNRRAQANLRRKRQERLQDLEQQLAWLESQTQNLSGKEVVVRSDELYCVDQGYNQQYHDQADPNMDGYQCIPANVLGSMTDIELIQQKTAMAYAGTLGMGDYDLSIPATQSVSILRSSPATSLSYQETSDTSRTSTTSDQLSHCAFDVLSKNASVLGISAERFLSTESTSPFYSPLQSTESMAASQAHLPLELQPTLAQLSYPHQPWIDCIPVPDLRSRIIFAVSHRPPLLESLDIWHDVLADKFPRCQQPTSLPSWALSDSFVKKWQMLLAMELKSLEAMCMKSNPPVRSMTWCGC